MRRLGVLIVSAVLISAAFGAETPKGAPFSSYWVLTEDGCPACGKLPTRLQGVEVKPIGLDHPSPEGQTLVSLLGRNLPKPLRLPLFVRISSFANGKPPIVDTLEGGTPSCLQNWKVDQDLSEAAESSESLVGDPMAAISPEQSCGNQLEYLSIANKTPLRIRNREKCDGDHSSLAAAAPVCLDTEPRTPGAPLTSAELLSRRLRDSLDHPEVWQQEACRALAVFSLPRGGWAVKSEGKEHVIQSFPQGAGGRRPVAISVARDITDNSTQGAIYRQIAALRAHDPKADIALALVTSFRESGGAPFRAGNDLVHSQKSGGLNNLAIQAELIRSKRLVPQGFDHWTPDTESRLRNPLHETTHPAWIPRGEMVVAYAAVLALSRSSFMDRAQETGFTREEAENLSPQARRAWSTIFFMGSGGVEYGKKGIPGGKTILTHLKALIREGKATGLEDVMRAPELRRYQTVKRALVSATDAEILEGAMGL